MPFYEHPAPPTVRFVRVSKQFTDQRGQIIHAVRDLNLTIQPGETMCLIGTSGCGKTTSLRLVNRLETPTSGEIWVGDDDVRSLDVITLRRHIGYVVQQHGLFPHMTVAQNVGLLARLEKWPRSRVRARVAELLELVNMPPDRFGRRHPYELSGGQCQRVALARALMLDPPVILMDEPFGALDPITKDQVHGEFDQLQEQVGKTIIMVTHDMTEAFKLGDRVALMHQGHLCQVGTEDDFRQKPASTFVSAFLQDHLDG